MRLITGIFLAWALSTTSAAGASFVVLPAPESPGDSPSIVHLGQDAGTVRPVALGISGETPKPASSALQVPPPPAERHDISRSIVAMGEPLPAVSTETVAAIGEEEPKPRHKFNAAPLVIRGGIVGQPSRRTTPAAPSRPPDAVPEETASAAPEQPAEPPQDAQPQPRPEPSPRRAQQPPAAPTRMPE